MNKSQARSTLRLGIATGLLISAAAVWTPAQASNLVLNGGFEILGASPTDVPDWTPTGAWSAPGHNYFGGNTYNFVSGTNPNFRSFTPPEGSHFLSLGNYPYQGIAGVEQTISTVAGQEYTYSLYFGETGIPSYNVGSNQLFQVIWDNTVLYSISGIGNTPWAELSFTVTGTGSDTIAVQGYSYEGLNDIDAISLTTTGPIVSVPEPASLTLLSLGMLGLAFLMRRTSHNRISSC